MKLRLLCSIALAAAAFLPAAAEDKAVVIISTNGSQRQEAIKNIDRIEPGKQAITVKLTDGTTETFDYATIDRILVDTEWTAVKAITAADEVAVWPAQTSGPVNISGLKEGEIITVSNLKGATILSTKASGALTSISIANQPSGIYILSADNHSVKIIKK